MAKTPDKGSIEHAVAQILKEPEDEAPATPEVEETCPVRLLTVPIVGALVGIASACV